MSLHYNIMVHAFTIISVVRKESLAIDCTISAYHYVSIIFFFVVLSYSGVMYHWMNFFSFLSDHKIASDS